MTNAPQTSRLCQLILQDHNGYLNAERPEALEVLRTALEQELVAVESELLPLEEEYRQLVKGDNTVRRMEVANRKTYLARRSEDITYELTEDERLKKFARSQYAKSKELQDSLAEQRQIINSVWGNK
jgi:hypothetical protein